LLEGRETPGRRDVRRLAHPVLRHRLVTNFHAEAENMAKDTIIDRILEEVGE
jgi:MoxR-like ATPase